MYHLCARRQFTSIELLPYHSSKFFGGRWVGKLMSVTLAMSFVRRFVLPTC